MEKILFISIFITFLFIIFKILESKYLENNFKSIKYYIRDIFMVFISSFISIYLSFKLDSQINDFLSIITKNKIQSNINNVEVFTDIPNF